MNRYIAIKTSVSVFTGVMVTTFLWALDVDFPVLWGLVALLLNFIPTIGSIIAGIPPSACWPLVQSWPRRGHGSVALGFLLVHSDRRQHIGATPYSRGQGLATPSLSRYFVSLIFWGWLFGPVGMLLSVPLTMSAKICFREALNPNTALDRPLAS